MAKHLTLQLNEPLETRIAEFRNDPEKMKDVNEFLNELFENAKTEAHNRQKQKSKLVSFICVAKY